MNIGTDYLALVFAMQKDWKDKTTNLAKVVLKIIRHFEFLEWNKKICHVMQVSSSIFLTNYGPKDSCTNLECVKKG